MTYEKAIADFWKDIEMIDFEMGLFMEEIKPGIRDRKERYEFAIEAIGKQIPMRPYSNNIDARMLCPMCKKQLRTFLNTEDNLFTPCRVAHFPEYCEYCGQAIDWSEEDKG